MARFQRLACPSCGDALDVPVHHEQFFKCATCGATLEDTQYTAPTEQAALSMADLFAQTGIDQATLTTYTARATRTASRAVKVIVGVVTLGVLGGAAAGAYGIYQAVDTSMNSSLGSIGGGGDGFGVYGFSKSAVFPGEGSTTQVGLVTHGSDGERVIYTDLGAAEPVRWNTPIDALLPDDASIAPYERLVASSDRVLLTFEDHLYAFDRTTGAVAYQFGMPDAIINYCQDCLRVIAGDRVAALTAEGTLQVWDASTGTRAWSLRLDGDVPRQLLDIGGNPAVVTRVDDDTYGVRVYDAATGNVVHTQLPACTGEYAARVHAYDGFIELGDGSYIWHDGTSGDCAQKWSPGADAADWEIVPPDVESLGQASFTDSDPLRAGETLVMTTAAGLAKIDLASGEAEFVEHHEDVDYLDPIALTGDIVVLTEYYSRGTGRSQLVGVDTSTPDGRVAWQVALEGSDGSDGSITGEEWLVAPTAAGVTVASFDVDGDRITFQHVDPATGTSGAPLGIGVEDLMFAEPVGWRDGNLLLGANDHLIAIDPATATVVETAP